MSLASPPTVALTLLDPDRQAEFETQGFVTFPFLDAAQVAELRDVYRRHHGGSGHGFDTDFERADRWRRRAMAEELAPFWKANLDRVLAGHRAFMTSFLAKWPGEDSQLDLHQDWTYVDETRFRSVAFWIALDDAKPDLDNGPLHVVPGSHRLATTLRGTWTPSWYEPLGEYLVEHARPVPVRAGDAIVIDHRLLHLSPPNRSTRMRLALAGAVVPTGATLLHPVDQRDGTVRVLQVDDEWFASVSPAELWERPPGDGTVVAVAPQRTEQLDLRAVAELCGDPVPADLAEAAATFANYDLGPSRPPEASAGVLGSVVAGALRANHGLVRRAVEPGATAAVDTAKLPWVADLEGQWADIRAEWDAVADGLLLARMSDLAGSPMPVAGSWTALVLRENRGWIEPNAARCPQTTTALRRVPGLRAASFSVLGPGAEITPHRGHNNGVLRVHLGVTVPGPAGACTLQAGSSWLPWVEGAAFAFDDTFEHRAFNRSGSPRVSLMLEVDRPLDGPARVVNRLVQPLLRLDPQVRGARRRLAELDRVLNG